MDFFINIHHFIHTFVYADSVGNIDDKPILSFLKRIQSVGILRNKKQLWGLLLKLNTKPLLPLLQNSIKSPTCYMNLTSTPNSLLQYVVIMSVPPTYAPIQYFITHEIYCHRFLIYQILNYHISTMCFSSTYCWSTSRLPYKFLSRKIF